MAWKNYIPMWKPDKEYVSFEASENNVASGSDRHNEAKPIG